MWLFTKRGFYSIAQSLTPGMITVRARIPEDLEAFRKHYSSDLKVTTPTPQCDYEFRADITPEALAKALAKMAPEINYTKFKPEAARFSFGGHARHTLYLDVWHAMYRAREKLLTFMRRDSEDQHGVSLSSLAPSPLTEGELDAQFRLQQSRRGRRKGSAR